MLASSIPLIASITTCCFTASVEYMIVKLIIEVIIFVFVFIFLDVVVNNIQANAIAQWSDGKQFNIGVSTQNISLVNNSIMFVPVTSGLLTVVGNATNIMFAITVINM